MPYLLTVPQGILMQIMFSVCHTLKYTSMVHWDDPEGWDGEGGGRGDQDGEHM